MNKTRLSALTVLTLVLASCGQQAPQPPATAQLDAQYLMPCDAELEPCTDPTDPTDPTVPTDPAAPVGLTGQNLRVRLVLDKVVATDTEDITPTWPSKPVDEFYMIGAVYTGDPTSGQGTEQGFATNPFNARKGSTYFPNTVVFDRVVAPGTQLATVARGYDEDINKDYNVLKIAAGAYKVASFACKYFCKDPQNGEFKRWLDTANSFISGLKNIWSGAVTVDQDDNLHERGFDFGVLNQNQSGVLYRSQRYSEGGIGYSTWDYTVQYRLIVEPTDAPVTQ